MDTNIKPDQMLTLYKWVRHGVLLCQVLVFNAEDWLDGTSQDKTKFNCALINLTTKITFTDHGAVLAYSLQMS